MHPCSLGDADWGGSGGRATMEGGRRLGWPEMARWCEDDGVVVVCGVMIGGDDGGDCGAVVMVKMVVVADSRWGWHW
ncbi:hypothetical protein Tco_0197103 [Tanacetum coccineum]